MPTTSKGDKKIRHWKHGWIPISPQAKAYVAGRGPRPGSGSSVAGGGLLPRNAARLAERLETDAGFTYDPRTGGLIEAGSTRGFAVARPGTTEIIGYEKVDGDDFTRADFIRGVTAVMAKHRKALASGAVLGGWYDPDTNAYMVQVSDILPADQRDEALQEAQKRGQHAIFDFETGDNVFTPTRPVINDIPDDKQLLTRLEAAIDAEMQAAARYYTGPGYKPMNTSLRTGAPMALSVRSYMDRLDQTVNASRLAQDTTVYRGLQSGSWLPEGQEPGAIISDKGYMSTATKPDSKYPGDTEWVVRLPKGYPALDLNAHGLSHHPGETELLLRRGTQLRVLSDQRYAPPPEPNGKRRMELEVVWDG